MSQAVDFINTIKDGAVASMKKHKVLASITIAQAILESGWGSSSLAKECKNLFGVKASGSWRGPKKNYPTYEYYDGKKVLIKDYFRVYDSYAASIEDHALFLVNNSRYRENGFFDAKDYIGQANALLKAGYATDPNYPVKLIRLIREYSLYKFDTENKEEEKKVKDIVVYNNYVDKRAAEYLGDYLHCPCIAGNNPFDYSQVENVYAVGGGEFTSHTKKHIGKGKDRWGVIIDVLKFCKKI